MCKISKNNMLMSVVQNYHLPMLERLRYAVRHSQSLCKFVSGMIPQRLFFLLFYRFSFENNPNVWQFQSQ